MKLSIIKASPVIFIIIYFAFILTQNYRKPKILVIYSQDNETGWMKSVDNGLNNVFGKKRYLFVRKHDMKIRYAHQIEFLQKAEYATNQVILSWHPNVIIALGRDAQNLLVKNHYINKENLNIIFGAISQEDYYALGYDHAKNVAGVIEHLPFVGTKDVLQALFASRHVHFSYLSDPEAHSKSYQSELDEVDWKPLHLINTFTASNEKEWIQAIKRANATSQVLIVRSYAKVLDAKNQHYLAPKDVIQKTLRAARIPVVGIHSHFVHDGGGLGIGVNGELNGEDIANLAVSILEKKSSAHKVIDNNSFTLYMRASELKREMPNTYIPSWLIMFCKAMNHYED